MKVGLNATCINDRPSGAKQRFIGIYSELIKRMPTTEFVIYEPSDCRMGDWFDWAPNVVVKKTPIPSEGRVHKILLGLRFWKNELRRENFDIFEGFNMPLFKSPTGKTLLTIHDIRRMHPEWGFVGRIAYRYALKKALRNADILITVSEAMKQELLQFYPRQQISVIYNGLNLKAFDQDISLYLDVFREKYSIFGEFILAVGHIEHRKNYSGLLDCMALLRDWGLSLNLIIIGNDSGERKILQNKIASLNLGKNVIFLSGLTDLDVRCAYKLCHLFVFPSKYEGFGIPILEAMASGCAMALSDIPVFREITQNRSNYFPPDDVEAMANTIQKVLRPNDENQKLRAYGYDRVKDFSFESISRGLENLYANFK